MTADSLDYNFKMSAKKFRLKGTVMSRWDFRKEDSVFAFAPQMLEKT